MIRFVDLRYQATGYRFAFFDTVTDQFMSFDGEQVFDVRRDLELVVPSPELFKRLEGLMPDWVDVRPTTEECFD